MIITVNDQITAHHLLKPKGPFSKERECRQYTNFKNSLRTHPNFCYQNACYAQVCSTLYLGKHIIPKNVFSKGRPLPIALAGLHFSKVSFLQNIASIMSYCVRFLFFLFSLMLVNLGLCCFVKTFTTYAAPGQLDIAPGGWS